MRYALSLLVLSSFSSISLADIPSMDCSFEWSELTTRIKPGYGDELSSLESSPRDGNSAPNSPRFRHSPRLEGSPRASSFEHLQLSSSAPAGLSAQEAFVPGSPRVKSHHSHVLSRSRRASIDSMVEASGEAITHRRGPIRFPLDGSPVTQSFELLDSWSVHFELFGNLQVGAAKIYVSNKNFNQSKELEWKSKARSNPFEVDPLLKNPVSFSYNPRNSVVSTVWNPVLGGTQREITLFKANCIPFDPEIATSDSTSEFHSGSEESDHSQ